METKTIEDAVTKLRAEHPLVVKYQKGEDIITDFDYLHEQAESLFKDVEEALKAIADQSKREERNSYKFDIEGKMYLTKELVKHIEHDEKLNASFERGRVDAFEEMLQTLT